MYQRLAIRAGPARPTADALPRSVRAGLYARVSTTDQTPENQLDAIRAYVRARGWGLVEFISAVTRALR